MADEARLIIELLDKAGGQGVAASSPGQPGAANVPGSTVASDFQNVVSQNGAGARTGQGSSPAPPSTPVEVSGEAPPSATPIEVPKPTETAPPTLGEVVSPKEEKPSDPLFNVVRDILQKDPGAKPEEISKALGIDSDRASSLIDSALGKAPRESGPLPDLPEAEEFEYKGSGPGFDLPEAEPFEGPGPTPVGTPGSSTETPKATDPSLAQFAEQIKRSVMTPDEEFAERQSKLKEALDQQLLDQESHDRALKVAQDRRDRQNQALQQNPPTPNQDEVTLTDATQAAAQIFNAAGGRQVAGMMGGQVGSAAANLVGVGLANAGQAASLGTAYTAAGGGMAGLVAAAGPAAAVAGIAAAAIAVPIAATAAGINEAERAAGISVNYSAAAAGAAAEADMRQIQADVRTAERLGDEVARYIEGRSRLSTGLQGIRDQLSEPFLRDFGNVTMALGAAAENLNKILGGDSQGTNILGESLTNTGIFTGGQIFGGVAGGMAALSTWKFFAGMGSMIPSSQENIGGVPYDWLIPDDHLPLPGPFNGNSKNENKPIPVPGL